MGTLILILSTTFFELLERTSFFVTGVFKLPFGGPSYSDLM